MEYVKSVFNVMNWNVAELHPDMGLDLNVKPFDNRSDRRALPWQFNVQVKGRASASASRAEPHVVVKGQSVTDWLADQIPVLIVLCQVTGYRVEAALLAPE
jgi:hypothetical protein